MPRSSRSRSSSMALATGVDVRRTVAPDGLTVTYTATDADGFLSSFTVRVERDCAAVVPMTHLYFRDYAPRPPLTLLR